ncbi:dTDP-4-dehydrorhamnose reductase [Bartonella sp. LJL80]
MKILVTGKNGQVAQALLACAKDGLDIIALGRPELDITDKSSVERAVKAHKPDIIVNAAAYTAVDKAEDDVAAAFAINRDGAKNVAEVAAENCLPIIHISTDYVFNGEKDGAYEEDDATGPLNVYGLSKLEGEWAVQAANPDHVILRTAWVYSSYGSNFVKTMLKLAETRDEISVVCDQWGTPTSADFIAENIVEISRQILGPNPPETWRGIFHLVPDGKTNWADFAREIFLQKLKNNEKTIKVTSIPASRYKTIASRPQNSIIDNQKIRSIYHLDILNWKHYL